MAMSTYRSLRLTVLWTALLGFAVDQGTKWLIMNVVMQPPTVIPVLPFFNLRLGFNTGVSFGLFDETFADAPALLAGLMLLIVVMLAIWALRAQTFTEAIGLGLVISGALGNIIDRFRIGAVIDFLDLHAAGWHWPTFNMADISIVTGAVLLMLCGLIDRRPVEEDSGASVS